MTSPQGSRERWEENNRVGLGHCVASAELKQTWQQEALLLKQGHRSDLALLKGLGEREIIILISESGCESVTARRLVWVRAHPPYLVEKGHAFLPALLASQRASHEACRANLVTIEIPAFLWDTFSQRQLTWRFQHSSPANHG